MNSFKKFFGAMIIAIFISMALLCSIAAAESKKEGGKEQDAWQNFKMGYVDMAAILAFHPLMQYYSYDANIFLRPLKGGISKTEFLKQIRDRQEKYKILKENTELEIKKIQASLDLIESEINKLRVKVSREQAVANQAYSEEYTKLTDENTRRTRTNEYHNQLSKLDRDYYDEKKKLDDQKQKKYDEMNNVILKISEVDYLNDVDSKNFFNSILDEIDEALKEVAAEKKIPVILNSNYISMFTPNEMITFNNYETPVSTIKTNIPPMANYSYLIENVDGPADTMATNEITARKEYVKNECTKLMNRRIEIARLFARYQVLNRMVVCGGVDLTAAVLEKLLKKHAVADYKIPVITETLNGLLIKNTRPETPVLMQGH
ncbi:MAG: hypothetical protein BWY32_00045 [bacterium ADurb.Bin243]|nr:MAG: hypothetical protein BWY32_00045 [bacterium ADurb.Bin243]HOD40269.1 hypothetical protein [Candidatus Wallbacteria bacterium]